MTNTPAATVLPSLQTIQGLAGRMFEGILLYDGASRLVYANAAAHKLCGECYPRDLSSGLTLQQLLPGDALAQARAEGRWSGHLSFGGDAILMVHVYFGAEHGEHFLVLMQDLRQVRFHDQELLRRHAELNVRLTAAQEKLLQSEKLASIGQLAAGVAHEINNPIGYVHSNLGSLQEYLHSLFSLIEVYERALRLPDPKAMLPEIEDLRARADIDFITGDLPQLMSESREGIERVTAIVRNLKDFSYSGRDDSWKSADLHAGLDSTINIIWNELKYKVTLEKHYGKLPLVQCRPSELNQVFMNILLNASHAIDERGTIHVTTGVDGDEVWVEIQDSGHGIPDEILQRIFDPFFTTKPVGSGTGLGLSISYGIVKKHNGRIEARNVPGAGACFRIMLPIRQPSLDAA